MKPIFTSQINPGGFTIAGEGAIELLETIGIMTEKFHIKAANYTSPSNQFNSVEDFYAVESVTEAETIESLEVPISSLLDEKKYDDKFLKINRSISQMKKDIKSAGLDLNYDCSIHLPSYMTASSNITLKITNKNKADTAAAYLRLLWGI